MYGNVTDTVLSPDVINHFVKHHSIIRFLFDFDMTRKQEFSNCYCPNVKLMNRHHFFKWASSVSIAKLFALMPPTTSMVMNKIHSTTTIAIASFRIEAERSFVSLVEVENTQDVSPQTLFLVESIGQRNTMWTLDTKKILWIVFDTRLQIHWKFSYLQH